MSEVVLGPLLASDAERCAELEEELFPGDDPWSAAMFRQAVAAGHHYLAARVGEVLVGYGGFALVGRPPDVEGEVHTVAVDPRYRGRGIGRRLVLAMLEHAAGAPVYLEVRTDNEPALALYGSEGFEIIGTRRGYYRPSGADAFTMRRVCAALPVTPG